MEYEVHGTTGTWVRGTGYKRYMVYEVHGTTGTWVRGTGYKRYMVYEVHGTRGTIWIMIYESDETVWLM